MSRAGGDTVASPTQAGSSAAGSAARKAVVASGVTSLDIVARVTDVALDLAQLTAALGTDADTGAVTTFVGLCRGEAGRLTALELEHYPGMAEAEIARIAAQAAARWPVRALHAVHRHGVVGVGAPIVFVGARSSHRDAAFDAVRFVMDFLKTEAPFWKREHLADGTVGPWVDAAAHDDLARERWAPTRG